LSLFHIPHTNMFQSPPLPPSMRPR
jgi:hypothetical protein